MPIDRSQVTFNRDLRRALTSLPYRFIWKAVCINQIVISISHQKPPCRTIRAASALIHLSNNSHYVALLIWERERTPRIKPKKPYTHTQSALTCFCLRESRTSFVFYKQWSPFQSQEQGAHIKTAPSSSLWLSAL